MSVQNRIYDLLALMCAVLLATGCSHVNHLRDAQDSFNQAAKADNLYRYADLQPANLNGASPATDALSASTGYAAAIASIEELKNDTKARSKLEADELYGYALALQSLAYWRLQKWDQAVDTSRTASATGHLGDRDLALMNAIPGLIKNDQAFEMLTVGSSTPTCTKSSAPASPPGKWKLQMADNTTLTLDCDLALIAVRDQLGGALCDVDTARIGAPSGHPVRTYLALSQLAVVANIRSMCGSVTFNDKPIKFNRDCADATIRTGSCVAVRYNDKPGTFIQAMVNEVCGGRPLRKDALVVNLVTNSGIGKAQIEAGCPLTH